MSYSSILPARYTRITGDTIEHLIAAGRVVLFGIIPSATTTGTVTLKDANALADGSATTIDVAAIGLTQPGKNFGPNGIELNEGLTLTLSAGADAVTVVWAPYNQ